MGTNTNKETSKSRRSFKSAAFLMYTHNISRAQTLRRHDDWQHNVRHPIYHVARYRKKKNQLLDIIRELTCCCCWECWNVSLGNNFPSIPLVYTNLQVPTPNMIPSPSLQPQQCVHVFVHSTFSLHPKQCNLLGAIMKSGCVFYLSNYLKQIQ